MIQVSRHRLHVAITTFLPGPCRVDTLGRWQRPSNYLFCDVNWLACS
jgi:hypothetical protein